MNWQCKLIMPEYGEIRAKNNGYDSVEIIDDGIGIESDNFDSLCKPHSTSKLSGLNDFSHLSTLGFRGEALNALCALSSITVLTRYRTDSLGTKLRFDHSGNVVERTSVARSVGTTVIVESLFETLPVRRKEFEKIAKKEFSKVLTTVQSFALSRPDVKFICSNTVAGKRLQQICTPGNANIRDVVTNLFGGRTDKNMMVDIVRCLPNDEVCLNYGLDPKNTSIYADYTISGFVSSCEHGFGRSTADRQFVYVNQRPVDYAKICRVVNEVYQQYNRYQYPTLVLNIEVPPNMIDVNVTPDKRMVFFEREKELLALIRSSLLATFHPLLGAYTSVEDNRSKGKV
ncbi:DNA mismatch repair protein [Teladorsagia circumcincta]|uniref:DNA mismatch repair protein n=1 Tax=Teladorsagia circumcincta TaxID=45464 RepID=A0A2G9V464_TELCI|nr:DNA mismatch repair protein [Teladorsagia circumcincta]